MITKRLTVYEGSGRNYLSIPKIIVQGQWLGKLGFSIGDKIMLNYQQNKIIIERIPDEQLRQEALEAEQRKMLEQEEPPKKPKQPGKRRTRRLAYG